MNQWWFAHALVLVANPLHVHDHTVWWRGSIKPLMVVLWSSAKSKWRVTVEPSKEGWFAIDGMIPAWLAVEAKFDSLEMVQLTV